MALRSQRAVLANLDRMSGRRMRRMTSQYRTETLGPLASTIDAARSPEEALAMLNGALLRSMATEPLAGAISEHDVQTQCIGRTAALREEAAKAPRQQGGG